MTDYTITTNFGAKDSLPSGNAAKVVKGSEFTTEFTNIATAVSSKADTAGDTFTGVVNFSDDVAFDTDTLFVDASTNRVGMGTASPAGNLHISAGTTGDATLILEADTDNLGDETDNPKLQLRQDANLVVGEMYLEGEPDQTATGSNANYLLIDAKNEEGTSRIQFATGGTTGDNPTDSTVRMTVGDDGNVGIGTSSPNKKLHIKDGDVRIESTYPRLYLTDTDNNSDYSIINNNGDFRIYDDTNNAYRMVINSSGNVGIGTTSPAQALDVVGNINIKGTVPTLLFTDTDSNPDFNIIGGGSLSFRDETNSATRMLIDSSGNVLVGTTDGTLYNNNSSGANSSGTMITPNGEIQVARYQSAPLLLNRMGNDGNCVSIRNRGVEVGRIYTSSTATAYITSSDERLKENITDSADAGSKVDAIQIRQFDWKVDGSHQDYGVIAQELIEVVPEAVAEGDTEEDMMGVDYSKLVPLLVKEVQALRSRVAQLEESE